MKGKKKETQGGTFIRIRVRQRSGVILHYWVRYCPIYLLF